MYLGETQEYKHELSLLIEEFLESDNISEEAPYWWLTELAAKCTAKRMVPDYISEKIMLELKIDKNGKGNCYPCINEPVPNNSNVISKPA